MFDAPNFQHRSIFQVLPDPKKKRVSDLGWIIDEEHMTMDQIMQMVNSEPQEFKNIEKLRKLEEAKDQVEVSGESVDYEAALADIFDAEDFTNKDDHSTSSKSAQW